MREKTKQHTSSAHREEFHFCFSANTKEDFATVTNMPDKITQEWQREFRRLLVITVGLDVNYLHMQRFNDLSPISLI